MRHPPKFFITHEGTTGVFRATEDAAVLHHRQLFGAALPRAAMGHRKFDFFTVQASVEIFFAYFRHLAQKTRTAPYYIFNVRNIELGKYVSTSVLRDVETNANPAKFAFAFHIALLRACFVYGAALRSRDTAGAISLGDAFYLDGIWIDFFLAEEGPIVYLSIHPYGQLCIRGQFSNLTSLLKRLAEIRRQEQFLGSKAVSEYMKKRLEDPKSKIFYYTAKDDSFNLPTNLGSTEKKVVIYAHSFTDSQMEAGFDGFKSVYDWLIFTVRVLSNRSQPVSLFLKAHPSFFNTSSERSAERLDKRLWDSLVATLPLGVHVVSSSVTNAQFLSKFDPAETIVISHHGNAIVEAAYLGFTSISSIASPWGEEYCFSETWSNREEYAKLLGAVTEPRKIGDKEKFEVEKFISDVYLNASVSITEDTYLLNVISRHCATPVDVLRLDPFAALNVNSEGMTGLVAELSSNVKMLA